MAIKIQIRGDTAAAWTAANPTLAVRELALETDTQRFKAGDGATAWVSLPYIETIRELERVAVTVSAGTLTLDMANAHERKFEVAAAQSSAFAIAFANVTQARFISLTIPITGAVAITMPSNVVSRRLDTRWNNTTRILTVTATGTGDWFELAFNVLPGPIYILRASDANYPS
jgi:hypothetical protein